MDTAATVVHGAVFAGHNGLQQTLVFDVARESWELWATDDQLELLTLLRCSDDTLD